MSIKIYDGMIIRGNINFPRIFKMVQEFQDICQMARKEFIRNFVLEQYQKCVQDNVLDFRSEKYKKTREIVDMFFRELLYGNFISLLPISSKKCLVLPYLNDSYFKREIYDKFLKDIGCEEYGYWDNSDRDENLTSRQWNQREKDWKNAFTDRIFCNAEMSSFCYIITDTYYGMDAQKGNASQKAHDNYRWDFWQEDRYGFCYLKELHKIFPELVVIDGYGNETKAEERLKKNV